VTIEALYQIFLHHPTVQTDTRKLKQGDLFFALKGPTFNGNTFAEIGRALANALLSDLPLVRRKEASSAVAHFITGVLDQDLTVAAIDSLWKAASFAPGDRVKTLRGTTHGVVLRLADDGRVVWRQDGGSAELVALPEGLLRLQ